MTDSKHHKNMTSITLDNIASYITNKGVDTLMVSKLLRQFDFSEGQAEVVSELIKQTSLAAESKVKEAVTFSEEKREADSSKLASKHDLFTVKTELELQIAKTKSDLEVKIETIKFDLIKWVAGLMLAQVGLIFALIKFFTNF